jgi:hypothetical protein
MWLNPPESTPAHIFSQAGALFALVALYYGRFASKQVGVGLLVIHMSMFF